MRRLGLVLGRALAAHGPVFLCIMTDRGVYGGSFVFNTFCQGHMWRRSLVFEADTFVANKEKREEV